MEFRSYMNAAIFTMQNSCIRQIEEQALQYGHISFDQMRLISLLESIGKPCTVSELARRMLQKPSFVSKTSEPLSRKELIKRTTPLDDRRQVLLSTTELGRSFYREVSRCAVDTIVQNSIATIDSLQQRGLISKDEAVALHSITKETYSDLSAAIESFSLRQHRLKELLNGTVTVSAFYVLLSCATDNWQPSIAALAQYLDMDKSTISGCVSELAKDGYIKAVRQEQDRRKITLTLTKKGETIISNCENIFQELFQTGQKLNEDAIRLLFKEAEVLRIAANDAPD